MSSSMPKEKRLQNGLVAKEFWHIKSHPKWTVDSDNCKSTRSMCVEFSPSKLCMGVPNCAAFEHLKISENIWGSKLKTFRDKNQSHVFLIH
jgi:hypothetical protein